MSPLVNISEAASLALHSMALMAAQRDHRFTAQELAARLQASGHHLAKVMQRLAKGQLVESSRGPQGGFTLARPAHTIKLLEIYEAVEGPLADAGCLLGQPICDGKDCVLGEVVQRVHREVRGYLARTRLSELARGIALAQSD